MPARILVAEDDRKQAELIRRYLEREGHLTVVVHDGRAAIDEARRRSPDLLVLDVMMPKVDGLDVCRVLRADGDVPIIMLTARSTEDDLLLGLDLGADDYLTKPYNPRELVARVRTVLRRTRGPGRGRGLPGRRARDRPGPARGPAGRRTGRDHAGRVQDPGLLGRIPRPRLLPAAVAGARVRVRPLRVRPDHRRARDEPAQEDRGREPGYPAYLQTVYGVGYKLADKVVTSDAS